MKILIVEDDLILQEALMKKLEKEEFEVLCAGTGKEGIIKAAKGKPDLILLDLMMPEMNGETALRHLKELPVTKDIPVIILSAVPRDVPIRLDNDGIFSKASLYIEKDAASLDQIVESIKSTIRSQ